MKVLVATKQSQGARRNDFCFCEEGELVRFGFECDNEVIDGRCGCRRSMNGMTSQKGTTTFKVVESAMSGEEFEIKVQNSLHDAGWLGLAERSEAYDLIKEESQELINMANALPEGLILEKRGDSIMTRRLR